jgi:hypothetical protein
MLNQAEHNREIADLLGAFNPIAIGKRITPAEHTRMLPGKHHYCFVDFETKEDMDAAIRALNGRVHLGSRLKVVPSRDMPKALKDQRTGFKNSRPDGDEGKEVSYSEYMARPSRALQSNDWRRRDD